MSVPDASVQKNVLPVVDRVSSTAPEEIEDFISISDFLRIEHPVCP